MGDEVKVSDVQAAEFLAEFRDRELDGQEASPVYQELIQFPQWQTARIVGEEAPGSAPTPSAELPDPREPARTRLAKEDRPAPTPQPQAVVSQNESSRSITTDAKSHQPNPWVNAGSPPQTGTVFLAVETNTPPPFPGEWVRRDGGWFRSE